MESSKQALRKVGTLNFFPTLAKTTKSALIGTPRNAAVFSFLFTAIVFAIFRSGQYPFISLEWYTLSNSPIYTELNIFNFLDQKYYFGNFRPLNRLVAGQIGGAYREYGLGFYWMWIPVYSLLVGLLSALIFGIAHIFSRKILTGLLAVFIFTFSIANIASTWHNIYWAFFLAPYILICSGIFAYLRYRQSGTAWPWLPLFAASCLLAPWFREIGYLPAAVVFGVELVRMIHKRSFFILLPGALLAHALFPRAIPIF